MSSPIEKCKDIIAKGEPCRMVTNTADPRVPISYRRAVSPAALLPILRLLVECEPFIAVTADDPCATPSRFDIAGLDVEDEPDCGECIPCKARALLDELRSES